MIDYVRENGLNLQWASRRLQNDHDVVLAAVGNNGRALQLASPRLRNNDEIVLLLFITRVGLFGMPAQGLDHS